MILDEAALVAKMAEELGRLDGEGPLELVLRPLAALHIAGLVQLALRHPTVNESHRLFARTFLDGVRGYFAGCPATLEILRRGDDPAEDV